MQYNFKNKNFGFSIQISVSYELQNIHNQEKIILNVSKMYLMLIYLKFFN